MPTIRRKSVTAFQKKFLGILFIVLCSSVHLFAQKQNAKKTNIPEPLKRMEPMLGKWEGNVHSVTGPVVSSREVKVSLDLSRTFNSLAVQLLSTYETIEQDKKSEMFGVIAYDSSEKQLYLTLMVDSGAVYHFTGKWTSDYSLNFSCNTKRNGKDLGLTIWMTSKISGQIDYRLYTTIGEETLITDEGKLMKKK